MKINVERLAKLAGLNSNSSGGLLRESASEGMHRSDMHEDEDRVSIDSLEEEDMSMFDEAIYEEQHADPDEMVVVDEKELVQELRRAKNMIRESKRRKAVTQERLQEAELKRIISSEIDNVLNDLNLNSSWVYGGSKPTRSRKGYSAQGSYLKGVGFK